MVYEIKYHSTDVPGYVLKKAVNQKQRLEMWFSEEMSECVEDIGESFYSHFEAKKIPVLQVTKFDIIEETSEIYQVNKCNFIVCVVSSLNRDFDAEVLKEI